MARIRRNEDLPSWFVLQDYQFCTSFTAVDWLTCLKTRRLILELISIGDMGGASDLAKRVRDDPTDCVRFDWDSLANPVAPLSFADLALKAGIAVLVEPAHPPEARYWTNTLNAIATSNWMQDLSLSRPIDSSKDHSQSLLVNLNATDSVLKDAFSMWLKDMRLQQKNSSKRERPAYEKWASYGLLPYIDLLIWEKLTGNKIIDRIMAEAVGCKSCPENFRKTTPPLATKLMEDLSEIEALATIEQR